MVGHTHAHRGCTVFGIICFFELADFIDLRPNTPLCTQSYHDIEFITDARLTIPAWVTTDC